MLFASFDFLLFLLPVLLGYWLLRGRDVARAALLVLASLFFYMASARPSGAALPTPWYFVGLLVGSTLLDYGAGLAIARARARGGRGHLWLGLSLLGNLGLLATFKYTGFLGEVLNDAARLLGSSVAVTPLGLLLPVGISFYTFQTLSYTIDVWRGKLTPEPNLLRFALYVTFFPQLVAGPIVRASEFLPQLRRRLTIDVGDVNEALFRISKGLLKKVVLGDFIAANLTDIVFSAPGDHSSLENLVALYAFTLQIYADFSGYSDIAIGVARLFGFKLPENFERPYQAASVSEFWRRWHMTLSTWLRDYLFFPLGGSRVGGMRAYFNLWLTMFLVGMWHGASWNFVIYANLHAAAMLFSRWRSQLSGSPGRRMLESGLVSLVAAGLASLLGVALGLEQVLAFSGWIGLVTLGLCVLPLPETSAWLRPVHVFLTFHFSVFTRVFFRADDLERARAMVSRLLELDGHGVRPGLFRVQLFTNFLERSSESVQRWLGPWVEYGLLVLLVLGLAHHFTPAAITDRLGRAAFRRGPALVIALGLAGLFAMLSQLLSGPRANIYFAF